MTVELQPMELDRSEASAWMEKSLRQGFDLSVAVVADQPFDRGRFVVLVPNGFARSPLDLEAGGVSPLNSSEQALSECLDECYERGAASVVVEDDMGRASDPIVARRTEPLAFVGERVVYWADLRDGSRAGARTIIVGAHGHPLNAFVTRTTSAELGLVDRQQTSGDLPRLIVESLTAVVVTAFDGESFLIWLADSD